MANKHFINMVKQAAASYSKKKPASTSANTTLCERLKTMKGKLTSDAAHDPDNRINSALRKNKCAEEETPSFEPPKKDEEKTASEVRHDELKQAADEYVKLIVEDIKAARL